MAEENQPTRRKLGEGLISETDRLIDELSGPVRRMRQEAASTLATMAYEQPEKIEADVDNIVDALIDALFRPEVRSAYQRLLDQGWTDAIRHLVPQPNPLFTWWSYRSPDPTVNDRGRRLDHVWASRSLAPHTRAMTVLKEARSWQKPSDHVPVALTFG